MGLAFSQRASVLKDSWSRIGRFGSTTFGYVLYDCDGWGQFLRTLSSVESNITVDDTNI